MAKRRKHSGHKKSSGLFGPNSGSLIQIDAMAYGAARQYVAQLIAPVTSMIPLGNFAEPVGLGLADWLIAKNTSGIISDVARKGLTVENAAMGSQIFNTGMNVSQGGGWILPYDTTNSY
jgi:hypothetical protein